MKINDPADHALFIDHQLSADLAVGCLVEGHTWEALRDAIQRAVAFMPCLALKPAKVGGLSLE